jgi:hypothetical protein
MQKTRIEYSSNLDALVAISKRLSAMEIQHNMASEEFYDKYSKGATADSIEMVEWANQYRHYLTIYRKLEKQLRNAA